MVAPAFPAPGRKRGVMAVASATVHMRVRGQPESGVPIPTDAPAHSSRRDESPAGTFPGDDLSFLAQSAKKGRATKESAGSHQRFLRDRRIGNRGVLLEPELGVANSAASVVMIS